MDKSIQAAIEAIKGAAKIDGDPRLPDAIKSTFTQSGSATSGLTFYDLEAGAKFLYPVLTPLRNEIPRVSGKGGIQANWRAVTGVNTSNLDIGVSVGNRGAVQAVSTADYTASYKGIGLEGNVDFEAQYAGMGFEDIRAIATQTLLQATMIKEEVAHLGGNNSLALGVTPTPSLAGSTTGGTLTNQTWSVIVVALTYDGYAAASVAAGIRQQVIRNNADGSTDTFGGGSARKSAAATVATTGTTSSIVVSVAAVRGAIGYAYFWGTAGNEVLGAVTTLPKYTITAAATGTQTAASVSGATDYSTNSLIYDGLMTQCLKSGSGGYWADLGGLTLTGDAKGGIVEIDAMLQNRWDLWRLSPDTMWVNSQEAQSIAKLVLAGSTTAALRFNVNIDQGAFAGGVAVTTYLNKFGMAGTKTIDIKIHPNMPPGVILFTSKSIPYPMNGVGNLVQVRTRQEYYSIEWPLRTRKWEYGVYADQVLQHYFPAAMGMITGIAPS